MGRIQGPDFVSRLSGYLNVLGPMHPETREWGEDPDDVCLRAQGAAHPFHGGGVEGGWAPRHRPGHSIGPDRDTHRGPLTRKNRSSTEKNRAARGRSDLPTEDILWLHVDADEAPASSTGTWSLKPMPMSWLRASMNSIEGSVKRRDGYGLK